MRQDLDAALKEALRDAMKDLSSKVCMEVRASVDEAFLRSSQGSSVPRPATNGHMMPLLGRSGSGHSLDTVDSADTKDTKTVSLSGSATEPTSPTRSIGMVPPISMPMTMSVGSSVDARPSASGYTPLTESVLHTARSSGIYDTYAPLGDTDDGGDDSRKGRGTKENSFAMKALQKFQKQNPKNIENWWSTEAIVKHPSFEPVVGVIVALNCAYLGFEVNLAASGAQGYNSKSLSLFMQVMDFLFCLFFAVEIASRIRVYGRMYWVGESWQWNLFDFAIVVLQVSDEVLELSDWDNEHFLCFMRIIRILRIVRLVHLFKELKTRVMAIVESLSSLVTTLVLLVMVIFCFSVLFTQMSVIAQEDQEIHELNEFFGCIPRTALTLLECIIGGMNWNPPAMVIFDHFGIFPVIMFIFYISFGVFVVLNVIMGVFIDKAIKVAQEDQELQVACAITGAFLGDDLYSGEEITWEVFERKLEDPSLQECFATLNVDIAEARVLFELIDTDRSGSVDAKEIVEGCLKLKGNAKALDMSLMLHMLGQVAERLESHVHSLLGSVRCVNDRVSHVDENLYRLCARLGYDKSLLHAAADAPEV